MSAFTADSAEGRILLGLRAGEMEVSSCTERWTGFQHAAGKLARAGLVECVDGAYRITPAGRAACPLRNTSAAPASAPAQPKELVMKQKIAPADVLAAIVAAGPHGTTVKALSFDFGVSDQTVLNARKKVAGEFFIRGRGVMVANQFLQTAPLSAEAKAEAALAAEVKELERQYDDFAFEIKPATSEPSMGAMANLDETPCSPVATAEPPPAPGPSTFVADLRESAPRAETGAMRYAVAFASDFHDTVAAAVARASECYDSDSLKDAIVIACTPLGRIAVRPVFVPDVV